MDEDWNETFFSGELAINAIGILSWDDSNHQWIITTCDKPEPNNIHGNGMVWDSTTLKWKGNDAALDTFKTVNEQ